MQKNLKSLLRLADLREEEVIVYMQLMTSKKASISQLKSTIPIALTTLYRTMNRLMERGLVEAFGINNKQKIYRPLPLTSLVKRLRREQRKLEKLSKSLEGLDEFVPYSDSIEIREGVDAMKEEYLNLVNNAKENLFALGSVPNLWDITDLSYHSSEERNFIKKRMSKGVYARVFNEDEKAMDEIQKNDSREKRTTKRKNGVLEDKNLFVKIEDYSTFFICDEDNPRVVISRHPDLLKLQEEQFYSMWKTA